MYTREVCDCMSHSNRPAHRRKLLQLFVMCQHFLMQKRILPIFQAPRPSWEDMAHISRRWAPGQVLGVSSYLHGSSRAPGLGVPPFQVWDL